VIAVAVLLFAAVTCSRADAATKLAQATAYSEDAKAQATVLPVLEELIAEDERDLAQERSNPSGIVDLRRLHEIGAALLQHRQARDLAKKTWAADEAAARKLLAEVHAIAEACRRGRP
jgi:hypothetical protein